MPLSRLSFKQIELLLLQFGFFLAGCLGCFYLQARWQVTPVVSAALVGLIGTFIPESKRIAQTHTHATIYSGAFVAMGSRGVDAGVWQIVAVSVVGSSLYFFLRPYFNGMGGRLGLIAFISSLLSVALRIWL